MFLLVFLAVCILESIYLSLSPIFTNFYTDMSNVFDFDCSEMLTKALFMYRILE